LDLDDIPEEGYPAMSETLDGTGRYSSSVLDVTRGLNEILELYKKLDW
jgi:hypothetical protein